MHAVQSCTLPTACFTELKKKTSYLQCFKTRKQFGVTQTLQLCLLHVHLYVSSSAGVSGWASPPCQWGRAFVLFSPWTVWVNLANSHQWRTWVTFPQEKLKGCYFFPSVTSWTSHCTHFLDGRVHHHSEFDFYFLWVGSATVSQD